MGRKARDPQRTGVAPTPPWKGSEPCPCGSGKPFAQCCLQADGRIYKVPIPRSPPGPPTGFAHSCCYLRWSEDCDQKSSREHFVSKSVLAQLGGNQVKLHGVPWLASDEAQTFAISSLTGKILCKRHNEALSPLDTTAGRFFSAIKLMHDDIFDKKTLSKRWKWLLFSGEELELWLLKTAIGLFYSGNVALNKITLCDTQSLNQLCSNILYSGTLAPPCGVYVRPIAIQGQLNQLQMQPLSDDENKRTVGFRMSYLSFDFNLLFDPNASYGHLVTDSQTYRPDYLIVRNDKRTHTVMLTWPSRNVATRKVVLAGF
jgi:hypothetical protein